MDDRVNSREAARLYGCSPDGLRLAMRKEGVAPEVRPRTERSGGVSHWWRPYDVMRVRAIRAERWKQAKLAFTREAKHPRNPIARRLLARNAQLEIERNKRLSRIATARGTTVAALRIDLGIDKP